MPRNPFFFVAFALSLAFAGLPAAADSAADCSQAASPDLKISACTVLLARKGLPAADRAAAFVNRGTAHRDKGGYDSAIADYDEAAALNAKDGMVYCHRGNAYADKGDHEHAIADWKARRLPGLKKMGRQTWVLARI